MCSIIANQLIVAGTYYVDHYVLPYQKYRFVEGLIPQEREEQLSYQRRTATGRLGKIQVRMADYLIKNPEKAKRLFVVAEFTLRTLQALSALMLLNSAGAPLVVSAVVLTNIVSKFLSAKSDEKINFVTLVASNVAAATGFILKVGAHSQSLMGLFAVSSSVSLYVMVDLSKFPRIENIKRAWERRLFYEQMESQSSTLDPKAALDQINCFEKTQVTNNYSLKERDISESLSCKVLINILSKYWNNRFQFFEQFSKELDVCSGNIDNMSKWFPAYRKSSLEFNAHWNLSSDNLSMVKVSQASQALKYKNKTSLEWQLEIVDKMKKLENLLPKQ